MKQRFVVTPLGVACSSGRQCLKASLQTFAELRTIEKKSMYMADWVKKLDEFLILNEKEILTHTGKISHKEMEIKVREELEKFNEQGKPKQIEAPKSM